MKRPIAISLSPNTQKDDVLLALKTLFTPIKWFDFRETEKLENEFAKYFGKEYKAMAVNSGRSAEYLILKALGIQEGDKVAVQALTCVAAVNPILWNEAKPIFIDVDDTYNMDPNDLEKKVSENTRAIIVQHTFGVPTDFNKIKIVTQKHCKKFKKKVYIIEDCAVSLGAKYHKKKVGTLSDVSFFSFGRDKVISSVFGGMILCKDEKLYENIKKERDELLYPSFFWVTQQLLHPILFSVILPLYNFGFGKFTVGKMLMFILQKTGFLSRAVYSKEKIGLKPKHFPGKMPGGLSILAINQLKKLDNYNKIRE